MARKVPLSPEWPGSDCQPFHLSQIESFLDLDGVLIMLNFYYQMNEEVNVPERKN